VRVLLVNAHGADPTGGGTERYVGDLAAGLRSRGHHVETLSAFPRRDDPAAATHVLHRADWRVSESRRIRNHLGALVSTPSARVAEILAAVEPDVVHTNNLPGIATGIWEAARRAGVPVVHTLHDHYLLCPRTTLTRRDGSACTPHPLLCGARTRRLTRWSEAVDALIGPSEYILGVHRDLFPGDIPRHVVRPPLKPLEGPSPEPLQTPPRTLGYVGSLTQIKGVALLLAAAPALLEAGFTLRIAGDGALRGEVEAAKQIRYEGWLRGEELEAFVGSCDAGLVPSLCNEASGPTYVVCEWLAAGRPVVATRRGGLAEAGRGGGVSLFDGTPAGLAEAVLQLRNEAEWRRMVASLPVVGGDAELQRWLDEHEAAYDAAFQAAA
jgi:glycosyltransferase involved in cell wall biosynthesis